MQTLYVDTQTKLHDLCESLQASEWIALDTEFMRERTYYPQLCLIQVAIPGLSACIDPLNCEDLSPLLAVIYNESIVKVVHSGSQDMEIFFHLQNKVPAPLFDTQIAAPLLGYPEQAGYAKLVEAITGTHLDKAHTRADWSHRPLSAEQIKYALNDVIYLCEIYVFLKENLVKRNRLAWLDEDFIQLADSRRYANQPQHAWRRLKSTNKLRGGKLAVAQSLACWREATAQSDNKPRGWLLKDDVLTDIARQLPKSMDDLGRMRGLHDRIFKRYGKTILDLIASSIDKKPEPLPAFTRSQKPDVRQEAVVDLLNAIVHLRAAEQELSPVQLASRKELQQLVMGGKELEILQGWRYQLVGAELCEVLKGKLSVCISDGQLKIIKNETDE